MDDRFSRTFSETIQKGKENVPERRNRVCFGYRRERESGGASGSKPDGEEDGDESTDSPSPVDSLRLLVNLTFRHRCSEQSMLLEVRGVKLACRHGTKKPDTVRYEHEISWARQGVSGRNMKIVEYGTVVGLA